MIAVVALFVPLLITLGTARAQDAESSPTAPYYSDKAGPPQPVGVVNFLLYEDPDTLHPLVGQTSIAAQVSTATWGNLLRDAQPHMQQLPVFAIAPGLMIFLTVISINFVG